MDGTCQEQLADEQIVAQPCGRQWQRTMHYARSSQRTSSLGPPSPSHHGSCSGYTWTSSFHGSTWRGFPQMAGETAGAAVWERTKNIRETVTMRLKDRYDARPKLVLQLTFPTAIWKEMVKVLISSFGNRHGSILIAHVPLHVGEGGMLKEDNIPSWWWIAPAVQCVVVTTNCQTTLIQEAWTTEFIRDTKTATNWNSKKKKNPNSHVLVNVFLTISTCAHDSVSRLQSLRILRKQSCQEKKK